MFSSYDAWFIKEGLSSDQINWLRNSKNSNVLLHHKYTTPNEKEHNMLAGLVPVILNLDLEDIKFRIVDGKYYYYFPPSIQKTIDQLLGSGFNMEGRYFRVETDDVNRLHFDDGSGLPSAWLGQGVGYKLYQAIIKHLGYASSKSNASRSAQMVWLKLAQDPNFQVVMVPEMILILDKDLISVSKLKLIVDFLKYQKLGPSEIELDYDLIRELKQLSHSETVLFRPFGIETN